MGPLKRYAFVYVVWSVQADLCGTTEPCVIKHLSIHRSAPLEERG